MSGIERHLDRKDYIDLFCLGIQSRGKQRIVVCVHRSVPVETGSITIVDINA